MHAYHHSVMRALELARVTRAPGLPWDRDPHPIDTRQL